MWKRAEELENGNSAKRATQVFRFRLLAVTLITTLPSYSSLIRNEFRSGLGIYTPNLDSARESRYLALKSDGMKEVMILIK